MAVGKSIFSNFEPKYLDDDDLASDALGYKFLHFRRRSLRSPQQNWISIKLLRNLAVGGLRTDRYNPDGH